MVLMKNFRKGLSRQPLFNSFFISTTTCFFLPTYAIIILNREGFHDWRREYEAKTNPSIGTLCFGACGMQQEARRGGDNPGANNRGTDDGCPD